MRIFLNKLSFIGEDSLYEVNFKKGLNFITGPIATGKSTILEMISYCLGKKDHKDYSEIKAKCNYVSLDLLLNGVRYKIKRPLFSFDLPAQVFYWNDEIKSFNENFDFYHITNPKNENSLAGFFQEKLEIPEFKLSGQTFSFRDIFKYSYVSQTQIDSENILEERNYTQSFKRKPTLEIILNSLNQLLNELKNDKKNQKELIDEKLIRKEAIVNFLRDVELFSNNDLITKKMSSLRSEKYELLKELKELKDTGQIKNEASQSLTSKLFYKKGRLDNFKEEELELQKYLKKLDLLNNQYSNEIIKLDYLIISNGKLKDIEFHSCPACNSLLEPLDNENCNLCGNYFTEFNNEEAKAFRLERKRLMSKLNSLSDFINSQKNELKEIQNKVTKISIGILKLEDKINEIQNNYVSPFLERIEVLNRRIGELDTQIENLSISENVSSELDVLSNSIQIEENKLSKIIKQILDIETDNNDFDTLIDDLSKIFYNTLKEFNFPKLTGAYIDYRSYMPYVRGIRYNQLGSLGAVTLINVAYFISILELSVKLKKSFHPKILMLDTIGKNLGTRDNTDNDEFRDSKIFKSMLSYLVTFCQKYENDIQMLVINNDYTNDINENDIIIKFDGDGSKGIRYGLVDDMR